MQNRINMINEQMKKEMSVIIRELKDPRINSMTSVVAADVSKDMRYAKIYVSVLGSQEDQQKTLSGLKSASGFIRKEIGHRLGLRNTPDIEFELDHSIEYGARINKILNDLEKKQ